MIELGNKVRDVVTGLEGIAVSKVDYLNGCVQWGVKPALLEGKMVDVIYLDNEQLEVVGPGIVLPSKSPADDDDNGGPMADAPGSRPGGML